MTGARQVQVFYEDGSSEVFVRSGSGGGAQAPPSAKEGRTVLYINKFWGTKSGENSEGEWTVHQYGGKYVDVGSFTGVSTFSSSVAEKLHEAFEDGMPVGVIGEFKPHIGKNGAWTVTETFEPEPVGVKEEPKAEAPKEEAKAGASGGEDDLPF